MKQKIRLPSSVLAVILCVMTFFLPISIFGQEAKAPTNAEQPIRVDDVSAFQPQQKKVADQPLPVIPVSLVTQFSVLALLSLAPFITMLLTSFIKIVIVLSLLRNAIGSQQTPPNQVINGVALILTLYVMFPTGLAMYESCKDVLERKAPTEIMSGQTAAYVFEIVDKAKEPLRQFLMRYTERNHIQSFYQMSYRALPQEYRDKLQPDNFIIVIPAFVTSQIKNAFEVAVMVYLPFFVIDLVTSNILLAMGMQMLSPMTISLPLKLLLLVMVDGWTLITQGLVLSYR